MKKIEIKKEDLYEYYIEKDMTCNEISVIYGCSPSSIFNHLKKHGISTKTKFLNREFGKLLVLSQGKTDKHGHTSWLCRCKCGVEKQILGYQLTTGNTKTCGCSRTTIGTKHPLFNGYQEISGKLWNGWIRAANKRNLEFTITIELAWELFLQQKRVCALSGLPIVFAVSNFKNEHGYRTASLDRIDSSKGYVEGNVQWVHKDVNWMKQDYSEKYFLEICSLIIKNNRMKRRNDNNEL